MLIINCWKISLTPILAVLVSVAPVTTGISIPFFGSFSGSNRQQTPPTPLYHNEHKEARIINSHQGGNNNDGTQSSSSSSLSAASLAAGSFIGHSPWISGTRDQFIRDQLVVLHPDSPLNRHAWKESGYLNNMESVDTSKDYSNNEGTPATRTPVRIRKPTRKPKQQTAPIKKESGGEGADLSKFNSNFISSLQPASTTGSTYELLPLPYTVFRDMNQNQNADLTTTVDEPSLIHHHEPMLLSSNNFLLPFSSSSHIFPYSPRAIASHSTLPPEAMIQLLKSPEQELSPLTRPQVKLPFPLSHDCSANSGSKPLQFVVLPIVEPVAPLKPIFPQPSFLSSQYGQFPYIPPFNLFNKKPPVFPTSNLEGSSSSGASQVGGTGSSGQFVPILNRPAPPLPFVFVQSLPLELIGQNVEMDILNSSPSQTSENKINEVSSPVTLSQPSSTVQQQQPPSSISTTVSVENIPGASRPLPLIVIEKKKTPGQLPSSQIAPAATVVEISKQSIPKSGTGNGSPPLSTISVVKPITAPGEQPHTPQQQHQIHQAIEKLVPVAAAVLENVEKQQKQQKDEFAVSTPTTAVSISADSNPNGTTASTSTSTESIQVVNPNEQEKTSLRPPLRPAVGYKTPPPQNNVQITSSISEEIGGMGPNPTSMSQVEITEA